MIASFFLSVREGLEAALIIGVLLGALSKLDRSELKPYIWYGTSIAIALSITVGIILNLIGSSFEGRAEEIFEGVVMLLAAGILTWVILWMQSQSRAISNELEAGVKSAVIRGSKTALFLLAFFAVIREGIELAFFLTAASIATDGGNILLGALIGLLTVVVFAVLFFRSLIHLDISKFFRVTSIILILFAAGLVAHGVHEFNEAGIIPSVIEHVWNLNPILDETSVVGQLLATLVGYNANPSLTEVGAYLMYFGILWLSNKGLVIREQRQIQLTAE